MGFHFQVCDAGQVLQNSRSRGGLSGDSCAQEDVFTRLSRDGFESEYSSPYFMTFLT
jgi:hypothetical protein